MYKKLFVIGVLAVLYGFVLSACSDDEPASITGQDQTGSEKADKPRLAMNSGGNALTVWEQENVSGTNVVTNSYVPLAGWGAVEYLTRSGHSEDPDVAMSHYSNDAMAVWAEDKDDGWGVYARSFDGETRVWSDAVTIVHYERYEITFRPRVAIDENGNAAAIWVNKWNEDLVAHYGVFASSYLVSGGSGSWTTPQRIDKADDLGLNAIFPSIAMNGDGDAVATVLYMEGTEYFEIYTSLYVWPFDGGPPVWSIPTFMGEGSGRVSHIHNHIAINADGRIFSVWQQGPNPQSFRAYVNRHVSGVGWLGPEILQNGAGATSAPDVASDYYSGSWTVVWTEIGDSQVTNVHARRFANGSWDDPEPVENSTWPSSSPRVAMGVEGNAMVVWIQEGSSADSLFSSRFMPGSGWLERELIAADDTQARDLQFATDYSSAAIAVWVREDGTKRDVWANAYDPVSGWGEASGE